METTKAACDHATLTTPFCANCGKRVGTAREPGEIRVMRETIKNLDGSSRDAPGEKKSDPMFRLMSFIFLDSALSWALGEMSDGALLALADPKPPKHV